MFMSLFLVFTHVSVSLLLPLPLRFVLKKVIFFSAQVAGASAICANGYFHLALVLVIVHC